MTVSLRDFYTTTLVWVVNSFTTSFNEKSTYFSKVLRKQLLSINQISIFISHYNIVLSLLFTVFTCSLDESLRKLSWKHLIALTSNYLLSFDDFFRRSRRILLTFTVVILCFRTPSGQKTEGGRFVALQLGNSSSEPRTPLSNRSRSARCVARARARARAPMHLFKVFLALPCIHMDVLLLRCCWVKVIH